MNEWIKLTDKQPPYHRDCLIIMKPNYVRMGFLCDYYFQLESGQTVDFDRVTHWMEIPSPPE